MFAHALLQGTGSGLAGSIAGGSSLEARGSSHASTSWQLAGGMAALGIVQAEQHDVTK